MHSHPTQSHPTPVSPPPRLAQQLQLAPGERWYVVHSQPHKEAGAQAHLHNQKFRTFLPRVRLTRRHARKLDTVLTPFFPRYLFVVLDMERDRWRSINGTCGVSRLVTQNDRPQPVLAGVVEQLIACTGDEGLLRFDEQGRLRIGQPVELLSGPFAHHFGVVERLEAHERVRLLIELMDRKVAVSVSRRDVRPTA